MNILKSAILIGVLCFGNARAEPWPPMALKSEPLAMIDYGTLYQDPTFFSPSLAMVQPNASAKRLMDQIKVAYATFLKAKGEARTAAFARQLHSRLALLIFEALKEEKRFYGQWRHWNQGLRTGLRPELIRKDSGRIAKEILRTLKKHPKIELGELKHFAKSVCLFYLGSLEEGDFARLKDIKSFPLAPLAAIFEAEILHLRLHRDQSGALLDRLAPREGRYQAWVEFRRAHLNLAEGRFNLAERDLVKAYGRIATEEHLHEFRAQIVRLLALCLSQAGRFSDMISLYERLKLPEDFLTQGEENLADRGFLRGAAVLVSRRLAKGSGNPAVLLPRKLRYLFHGRSLLELWLTIQDVARSNSKQSRLMRPPLADQVLAYTTRLHGLCQNRIEDCKNASQGYETLLKVFPNSRAQALVKYYLADTYALRGFYSLSAQIFAEAVNEGAKTSVFDPMVQRRVPLDFPSALRMVLATVRGAALARSQGGGEDLPSWAEHCIDFVKRFPKAYDPGLSCAESLLPLYRLAGQGSAARDFLEQIATAAPSHQVGQRALTIMLDQAVSYDRGYQQRVQRLLDHKAAQDPTFRGILLQHQGGRGL